MREVRPKRWSARLPLTLALTLSSTALAQSGEIPTSVQDAARRLIAQRTGTVPEDVELVGSATVDYPLQGLTTYQFKGINTKGDAAGVTLDPGLRELSATELNDTEDALRVSKHGRASAALLELLKKAPEDQEVSITLWARQPEGAGNGVARPEAGKDLTDADVDRYYQQQEAWQKVVAAGATSPLIQKLKELGADPEADALAPVVSVALKPSHIRDVIQWDEVVEADVAGTSEEFLSVSRATIEADLVHAWGYTGGTVRKAVIEIGGRVQTGNPYMAPFYQHLPFSCTNVHANAVLGVLTSQHPSHRGIAPGLSSPTFVGGDCFGFNFFLQNVTNAASTWGARAFNLSWGSQSGTAPGSMDRYYDNLVQNGYRTVVAAAGNNASLAVASPARGYNVIAVGNFNDNGNVPWAADSMNATSAYINPSSTVGDREKPELAAPGTNITTLSGSFPWLFTPTTTAYGTSLSAPHVTGLATLMMHRNNSLSIWPEAVKSILMATAVHNVEGATRLSSRDGAGAVVATQADDVAHAVDGNWGAQAYSCASPVTLDITTMALWANRPARVVIAWDTNPSYIGYSSRPSADLDLQVLSPTNTPVASSMSWDNTYEIVEFTPPVAGPYKLRVTKYSCALTPKWLGWAWYQNH